MTTPTPARCATILVLGHACADLVTILPYGPGPDEKVEAIDHWFGGGGPAANAAVALARLGHDVKLACAVGGDALGRVVREELEHEGVELLVDPDPRGTTSIAQIQVVGAHRSVAWERGTASALDGRRSTVERWLDGVDLLYLDGHELPSANVALEVAASTGIAVLADLGTRRPGTEHWPSGLVWAVASARYAQALAPDGDGLDALRASAPGAVGVGVTRGEKGGSANVDGRRFDWRPRKVRVVDSTAAGDAFHAGLADAWLQGMDPTRSIEWASTLGAAVCRGPGGRRMLPKDRHQLGRFFERWPHRARVESPAEQPRPDQGSAIT